MTTQGKLRSADFLFNLPNLLTILRIILVPFIGLLLDLDAKQLALNEDSMMRYSPGRVAALVLAVAGLTDLLDGWLARKWNIVSLLGKFLDPLADKLLLLVCLVMLMKLGRVDAWLVIILLSRELLITGLRAVAVGEGIVISAGTTGKYKLAFQLVGLGFIMWYGSFLSFSAYQIGVWILYVALVISLYSGFQYLKDFFTELYDKRGYIARKPKQLV